MANQNNAYDFGLFEPRQRHCKPAPPKKSNVIRLPKDKLEKNRRSKGKTAKLIFTFLVFIMVSGMVAAYVNGQVQLSELSGELGTAKTALQEQQNAFSQLKIQSDSKLSMEAIENYASKQLGMKKTSRSQTTAIQLSEGDKSQVITKTANTNWLERIWEAIQGFLS